MILNDGFVQTLFASVGMHALLLWVVFFSHRRTQLSDYEGIEIDLTALQKVDLRTFCEVTLNPSPPRDYKGLFRCYLRGIPVLRILALTPLSFYGLAILCYVIWKGNAQLPPEFDIVVLGHWVLGIGLASHVAYFIGKMRTGILDHLQGHHPQYKKDDIGAVALWSDFYPTVVGYKK